MFQKLSAQKETHLQKGFLLWKPLQMQYQLFQVMAQVIGLDHQVVEGNMIFTRKFNWKKKVPSTESSVSLTVVCMDWWILSCLFLASTNNTEKCLVTN